MSILTPLDEKRGKRIYFLPWEEEMEMAWTLGWFMD